MKAQKFVFTSEERTQLLENGHRRLIGEECPDLCPVVKIIDPYGYVRLIASMDPNDQDIVWGYSDHGDKVHLEDYSWSALENAAVAENQPIKRVKNFASYQPVLDYSKQVCQS